MKKAKIKKENLLKISCGIIAGLANGLFGGGGGMLVVPFLIYVLGFETKKAHATALLIMLPISVLSGLIYSSSGYFYGKVGIPSLIGVVVGGIIGGLLLKSISSKILSYIFIFMMLFVGVKTVFF